MAALLVALVGCVESDGNGYRPSPPSVSDDAIRKACQRQLRRSLEREEGAADVDLVSARVRQESSRIANVEGAADVTPHKGPVRRYGYLCRYDVRDLEVVDLDWDRGSSPAPGASSVQDCQKRVQRQMSQEIGAAEVRFVSGKALDINPQLRNVQGEADVKPRKGPVQRYSYLCTIRRSDGEIQRSEYDRKGGAGPPAPDVSSVQDCQKRVRRQMKQEIGAAEVRFVSGEALDINPQLRNVQGEADVKPRKGPVQRYSYLCTIRRSDDAIQRSEYQRRG
jgi:hypothetical protein